MDHLTSNRLWLTFHVSGYFLANLKPTTEGEVMDIFGATTVQLKRILDTGAKLIQVLNIINMYIKLHS